VFKIKTVYLNSVGIIKGFYLCCVVGVNGIYLSTVFSVQSIYLVVPGCVDFGNLSSVLFLNSMSSSLHFFNVLTEAIVVSNMSVNLVLVLLDLEHVLGM
jgi:hypothetical protein